MPRLERDFQTEFYRSFNFYLNTNKIAGSYHKFKDTGLWKTPYDCQLIIAGQYLACELKIVKTKRVMNFTSMFTKRLHELSNLRKIKACDFKAYVVINRFLGRGENEVYVLDIDQANTFWNRGSVPLSDVQEVAIKLPRIYNEVTRSKVWDLSPLFE